MSDLKVSITVSRSRKINLSLYDPSRPYESVDFFYCESEDLPLHEATPKKREQVSNRLKRSVERNIRDQIKDYLTKLKEAKK